jgi:hypothetical protein
MSDNIAVISGIIGTHYNTVHFAPLKGSSFMFCNELRLKEYIESRGWIFCHVECDDIDINNEKQTNLRCKEAKFLKVLENPNFKHLGNYDYIIWIDHNLKLHPKHTTEMIDAATNHPISMKQMVTGSVMDELEDSMRQERYEVDRSKYLSLIEKYKSEGYKLDDNRPLGFIICYNLKFREEINAYCKEMLDVLYSYNIIQDQIVSFFALQKTRVNWFTWQIPLYSIRQYVMDFGYPLPSYDFDRPPILLGFLR